MEYPSSKGIVYLFNYLVYEEHLANTISNFDFLKLERALEDERMSNLELQKKVSTLTNQSNTSAEPTEHRGA